SARSRPGSSACATARRRWASSSTRSDLASALSIRAGLSTCAAAPFAGILRRVISWLLLGFAMGLRHSLEADHVAAVASLSARAAGPRDLLRVAAAWGIGHALTLLAVALLWAVAGVSIPDPAQSYVEVVAGLLL